MLPHIASTLSLPFLVSLVLGLGACSSPRLHSEASVGQQGEVATESVPEWPQDWVGTWSGTLRLEGGAAIDPVRFRLEIGEADEEGARPWRLHYGDRAARDYRLEPVDPAKGHWVVDEQNGIVLDARYLEDTFWSAFAVGEVLLVTRQRFFEDRIEHEIVTMDRTGKETGLEVRQHPIRGIQRAVLRRE